jgi:hypothetical protein
MHSLENVLPHILRQKRLRQLVLCHIDNALSKHFTTLFQDLTRLRLFSCDTWTLRALRSLDTLIEYSEDRVGSLRQLHCPELRDLYIGGPNTKRFEEKLENYLKPLMQRRGGQHNPKLVVHLRGLGKFGRLENMEGTRFE